MGGLRRGGMMVTIVAAALVLAALVTQGCARAAPPAPPCFGRREPGSDSPGYHQPRRCDSPGIPADSGDAPGMG
jgi:hypothetical protein